MASEATEGIITAWRFLSKWYTSNMEEFHANKIYDTLIPFLDLETAANVLVAGCGSGNGVSLIANQLRVTGAAIEACDLSEDMLAIFRERAVPACANVRCCNAEELPYEDASVDRYVSSLTLMTVELPDRMLSEAYRVLQDDGIAVFSVWGRQDPINYCELPNQALKQVDENAQLSPMFFGLNDPAKLREMMEAAGFQDVRYFFHSTPFPFKTAEQVWESIQ
jgi:ubiquinone/menaquinone biosynthesis C-methylase UbiE